MVNVGIASFAHMHADSYAACIRQAKGARLAAVWDDDPQRGREKAAAFGTEFIGDLGEFFSSALDAVVVTAENVKHRELVERAAAAGKWVLCEKPLATTIEDALAMIEACERAGVGLGTAFPCRYAPTLMAVRDQISSGAYGEIYAAACTNNGQFPGGWFAQQALAGGGATMDHTVHVADLLRWILGKEFTSVYCENGNLLRHGIDTDDVGSLHLEMDGGIIVHHIASWNRAASFPTWGDVTIEFIGEKGVLFVDAFSQCVRVYNDDTMRVTWAPWGGNMDLGLVQDFVDAVRDRRAPSITGIDGLRAVEVTVAAYKSVETGSKVKL